MANYHKPDEKTLQGLKDVANKLRINSIKATCASNSGHPTSCCSAAELMSVLFFHAMRYKADDPRNQCNDRFVLSKGHAAPILYAAWAEAGFVKESDLVNLRKIDSDLEGHPTPKLEFVDVATGSLGQGLGAACGMAYTGKYFDKSSYRVYCMLGDGECSEGSVWEAMAFASYYKLDNLVAILDINRLGQSEPAPLQHDMETYRKRCEAFGWNTYVVEGHDVEELCKAFWQAQQVKDKPTCIVARTLKGKGLKNIEDKENWHGKPIPKDKLDDVLNDLQSQIQLILLQPGRELNCSRNEESLYTITIDGSITPAQNISTRTSNSYAEGGVEQRRFSKTSHRFGSPLLFAMSCNWIFGLDYSLPHFSTMSDLPPDLQNH
ncbi:Transketolase [Oryzias melastigma]|uniref:Transketolase n=1 Tax=Oryzias melastigma TaxID=30732 RepID=A0A834EZA2_ORYME|nr:Transketolase [Oryzias melastigma]